MKPSTEEIGELKMRIMERRKEKKLSYADIGRIANVNQSQAWRICNGEFRTIGNNVVQVCKVLGVEVETVQSMEGDEDASWMRLKVSLRNLWDQTPEGARRITKILDTMADWRADK